MLKSDCWCSLCTVAHSECPVTTFNLLSSSCAGVPVHNRRKPVVLWATRSHIRQRCDCLVSCPYRASGGAVETCQAACWLSPFVGKNSFDLYVLYWAQPFVAQKKKAHGLWWNIRLVKRTVLKEPPASKCWNKWVSAWTHERAGLCLSLAWKAHPVIYCDGWGIKSSFLDVSLLVISGPKSTAMHVLEVLFKGVADRISHGDWGKNLQKQTCSQQRKFWCCCWLVGWLVLLLLLF